MGVYVRDRTGELMNSRGNFHVLELHGAMDKLTRLYFARAVSLCFLLMLLPK